MRQHIRLGSGLLIVVIFLLLWNLENRRAEASQIHQTEIVVVSINGSTERPIVLIRLVKVTTGIQGRIAVYDDLTTKKPADMAVFYNSSDEVVAIAWFDRFGIERLAVDSGFLHRARELTGVYVVLTAGERL